MSFVPGYRAQIDEFLHRVERPSRYIGGEWNQVVKEHSPGRVKIALCFPDVYEIGMSHLGFRLLYGILNRRDDMLAERAFTPWPDMQEELKARGLPLTTLESATSLGAFDIVGFSLQYELCFTNVLAALGLSGIPLRTARRTVKDPLVIAGGPVVFKARRSPSSWRRRTRSCRRRGGIEKRFSRSWRACRASTFRPATSCRRIPPPASGSSTARGIRRRLSRWSGAFSWTSRVTRSPATSSSRSRRSFTIG
jgi:hypothetical protein